jgi:hypothetical protein
VSFAVRSLPRVLRVLEEVQLPGAWRGSSVFCRLVQRNTASRRTNSHHGSMRISTKIEKLDRPATIIRGRACVDVPVYPSTSIPKLTGNPLANGLGVQTSGEDSLAKPMPADPVTCLRHFPSSRKTHSQYETRWGLIPRLSLGRCQVLSLRCLISSLSITRSTSMQWFNTRVVVALWTIAVGRGAEFDVIDRRAKEIS